MALQLALRQRHSVPIEVEGIVPHVCRDKSLAEIEQLRIYLGNRELPLAELFHVAGDPSDHSMVWSGDMAGVHWIGAKMAGGQMVVEGDAGRHIGSEMTSGDIHIHGTASDWVGAEMRGGLIHVRGDAGHLIGAAYRGSRVGMRGGAILVQGNVANEIGHTMRRGLLAVEGSCGDLAGFNMLAGTILVFGNSGIRHGAGMRRGTIGLLGTERAELLPTFRGGTRCRPLMFALLWNELRRHQFPIPPRLENCDFEIYHGDLLAGGRGEILFAA